MNSDKNSFFLLGNHSCMDFVNTRKNRKGVRREMLKSFSDVLDWFQAAGLLNEEERAKTVGWETSPQWSSSLNKITKSIITLRERLEDELLYHVLQGNPLSPDFLTLLNEWLHSHKSYTEIVPLQVEESEHKQTYRTQRLIMSEAGPEQLKSWIAELIVEFLCSQDLQWIHQCENPDCILFFYDNSKNHKRRWCSMKTCGNRMKAAEFYRKKKEKS